MPTALLRRSRLGRLPSPTADHLEKTLDFDDLLIRYPNAIFMAQVVGDSIRRHGLSR